MNAQTETRTATEGGFIESSLRTAVGQLLGQATTASAGGRGSRLLHWLLALGAIFLAWKLLRGLKSVFWTLFGLGMALFWTSPLWSGALRGGPWRAWF